MQRGAYGLIVLLTLTATVPAAHSTPPVSGHPLSAEAAPAQADRQANCVASVDAIRAEWRKLLVVWLAGKLCLRPDWPGGQRVRG